MLLPAVGCDWRWGVGQEITPWYSSLRLFRQRTAGDWMAVVARVRKMYDAPECPTPAA